MSTPASEPVQLHAPTLRWVARRCAELEAANMAAVSKSAKGSDRIALWANVRTFSELRATLNGIARNLEESARPPLLVTPDGDRIA
jgi:hypothetical protein